MYSVFELLTKTNAFWVSSAPNRYSEEPTYMISIVILTYYFIDTIFPFLRITFKLSPTVVKIQAFGEGKAARVRRTPSPSVAHTQKKIFLTC